MASARSAVLLLGLVSCGGPGPDKPDPCPDGTDTTWLNHGKPFMDTWCTSCHHSEVVGEARNGAPEGTNFDDYAHVLAFAERISVRTADEPFTMPPAAGPSDEARALLAEWIACDLPGGTQAPAEPCSGPRAVRAGDLAVATAADLDTFCTEFDAIGGNLVVSGGGDLALDCLCELTGDLSIEDAVGLKSVAFANLVSVGGSVRITDTPSLVSVSLPKLRTVGGHALFEANPALVSLDVGRLETVAWNFGVYVNHQLVAARPERLATVGGDLYVIWNDRLTQLSLDRVVSVGESLEVSRNALLERIDGDAYAVESVGTNLDISDNPSLTGFYGFEELRTVGNDVVFENNDAAEDLSGFTRLESVGGEVRIFGNERLGRIEGFDFLEEVAGDVWIWENPVLRFVDGFRVLSVVGSGTLPHELWIADLPALESVAGLDALRTVDALTIENTGLVSLDALHGISSIERVLRVVDNPDLPPSQVDALVSAIGAENIGSVTNTGNGG